jgi:hypothetical protein
MARRYDCPREGYEEFYIELPDEWRGEHSYRYDEAQAKANDEWSDTIRTFSIAIALLDDWRLPGLEGNPEAWDLAKMSLSIMGWVNGVTIRSYMECFVVPKVSPSLSQNGQKVTAAEPAGN